MKGMGDGKDGKRAYVESRISMYADYCAKVRISLE